MNNIKQVLFITLLAGLGYWGWQTVFPPPEKQIRSALQKLAETTSFTSAEKPLRRLGAINAIPTFFTTNAVVRVHGGGYSRSLEGKNEIREAAAGSRAGAQSLKVKFTDPNITVHNKNQAEVAVTATVYLDGDPNPQLQILKMTLQRSQRKWLIHRVDPVDWALK